jgi:hypothetical protein
MKKKYTIILTAILSYGLFLSSCYKEFNPASYAPAFTIGGFSEAREIKPTNLVGYWSFDTDLSNSVSGTAATNAATSLVNGFEGKAVSMNVANKSYITIAPTAALTTGLSSFTVSFWVNPTFVDADGNGSIDGILGLVNLSNTTGFWGNLDWFVENGSNNDAAKIVVHVTSGTKDTWINKSGIKGLFGTWSNHTVTYDASTSSLTYYMNGSVIIPATTVSWSGPVTFTGSGPWVFGCVQFQTNPSLTSGASRQDWASYLTGSMDEVRIYNTALTASEVNALVVLQGKGK